MADDRLERLAGVLVEYSTAVKEGDLVCIDTDPSAAPLVQAIWRRVLAAGAHPHLRVDLDGAAELLLREGNDAQVDWITPLRRAEVERADVRIAIEAEINTRANTSVDPERLARAERAREPLRRIHFRRASAGELRAVITLFPTNGTAQEANMSLGEYEDFVFRAGLLDHADPVADWTALGAGYTELGGWLGGRQTIRVVSDGTDLTLGVGGRTWIPCDGKENFPDGEIFTGPVESQVDGVVRFTYPATYSGRRLSGIELEFREGQVVRASADEGEDLLLRMLDLDEGARHVGEFAFGLNEAITEFTGHTLFDEKIGGTMHLALGASYPESGGIVQSALHWDLVCDLRSGSEVYADGEVVYRDGRFVEGLF